MEKVCNKGNKMYLVEDNSRFEYKCVSFPFFYQRTMYVQRNKVKLFVSDTLERLARGESLSSLNDSVS